MPNLLVEQNQLDYFGAFERPAFTLWGEGRALLEGMYDAFSGPGTTFSDFRVEGLPDDPSTQTVKVHLGLKGTYRFKFDRVEATMTNLSEQGLVEAFSLLQKGEVWLRATVPQFRFTQHLFGYTAHCEIQDGTSESALADLGLVKCEGIGQSRSSGIIFHSEIPEENLTLHLTVDHSLAVHEGLFLSLSIVLNQNEIDYVAFGVRADTYLRRMLDAVGLKFHDGER